MAKHMKRQRAPTTWSITRKGSKFVTRPNPGKSFRLSMPISIVFKTLLKLCKTTKEVNFILGDKEIIIDGTRRRDHHYSVGLMDVISFPSNDEHYRMVLGKNGKLSLVQIDKKESDMKLCKIIQKTALGKDSYQINCNDGRNLLVKKNDYKVGDSIMLKLPKQEIKEHIRLEKGNLICLIGGKHIGEVGIVERITGRVIEFKGNDNKNYTTLKEFAVVIGKDKPIIKIENDETNKN